MNSKQSKMLRKFSATKDEAKEYINLPADIKGTVRNFFVDNADAAKFKFSQVLQIVKGGR